MNHKSLKISLNYVSARILLTVFLLLTPHSAAAQRQVAVPPFAEREKKSQDTIVNKINSEASLQKKMKDIESRHGDKGRKGKDKSVAPPKEKVDSPGIKIKNATEPASDEGQVRGDAESFRETMRRLRTESPQAFSTEKGVDQLSDRYFNDDSLSAPGSGRTGASESPGKPSRSRALFEGLVPPQKDGGGTIFDGKEVGKTTDFPIKRSGRKKRGTKVNTEVPSVKHVSMSPASRSNGGDDIEIVISPIYDVIVQMPLDIEFFRVSSATLLTANTVNTNPNMLALKISGAITNPTPISLHVVDVNQHIYTFTIIGMPTDLSFEYPKTIVVSKRRNHKTKLGTENPRSVLDAMDVDDAIQIVVGDFPRTNEYEFEFVSAKYMHHKGYLMYGFRVFRKNRGDVKIPDLKFTIWANDQKLDKGENYSTSRDVEWVIEPTLSSRETRRRGYQVARVFVQVRASILTLEEWRTAFITASDNKGYTRFNFPPFIRPFRAPLGEGYSDEFE